MIRVDFFELLSFYLSLFIFVFFLLGFKNKTFSRHLEIDPRFIWHCSVCTHIYIDTRSHKISVCPRCGCYNTHDN